MAVNRDQILEPIMEAIRRNFFFIQKSIAASRPVLLTVAGYLLQFELITRQNHDDALASSRLVHQAATLMRTVELKIKSDPYLYFPRFTQVLRLSDLSYVADSLEQQALSLQMPEYKAGLGVHVIDLIKQVSEFKLLIHQHIQRQGQLKGVCSLKMLLCGPPETGKTTTMLRLTNNICCIDPNGLQFPSTVLGKPRTIQLRHMLIGDEKIWNFEENVKKLGQSLYSLILDPSHTTGTRTAISDVRAGSSGRQDTAAVRKIDLEEVTQLAKAEEWVEVKKKLTEFEHITILYVIDSGGQPECHEILPLLLDGHVLSLIFLDLTKELGDKHPVLFRTGNTTASTWKPLSNLTTGEVIQRILASVSSLRSDRYKSFAVFVGTYLDKATKRQVLDLDRAIQSAFKVFIDENVVCPVEVKEESEKYIVTLDNTSNDQGDIERLRTLILTIIKEEFRHDQEDGVPTGWMLLHLLLRHKYQEKGWCTMSECIATAASCGITANELPLVLKYIHKNYGTIFYYPDVLKDIVICDPDVILSPLKSVFEFVFACKFVTKKQISKDIRSTGEISQDNLEYCFKKDGVSLATPDVIALFKYSHILCETSSKNFFMPCLLQTDNKIIEEANDPQSLASLNPAPILFVPTSEFQINCATPLGIFSALVVKISEDGKWECNKSEFCFKNRIQFDVLDRTSGRTYTLELRLYATYIELRHIHGPIDTKVLVAFHRELCDALNRISQQFGHTKAIKWNWGFYCPGSLKEGGRPHLALVKREVPAVKDMTCIFDPPCRKRITDLEEKHKRWFEGAICERSRKACHLSQQQQYWFQPPPVQVPVTDAATAPTSSSQPSTTTQTDEKSSHVTGVDDEPTSSGAPPAKKLKISSQSTDTSHHDPNKVPVTNAATAPASSSQPSTSIQPLSHVVGSSFDEDELTPPSKKLKISSQSTDIGLDANKGISFDDDDEPTGSGAPPAKKMKISSQSTSTSHRDANNASRPTMRELISMQKRDGSKGKLKIIEWIIAHKLTQCVDFAHKLLGDPLSVKKLSTKHKKRKEKFVRAVLQKWLDRDDDDESEESLPCAWDVLVMCCKDANLDGVFIKLLRDNIPK